MSAVNRVYTYGRAPLSQDQVIDGQWRASHFGQDGHGNTRFLTDPSGQVTDVFHYDAFGNTISRVGQTATTRLHAGEEFDPDLGMYFLRARYYDPQRGRLWTRDSFEGADDDPASQHAYAFTQNNPVNAIDPSGHFMMGEAMAVSEISYQQQPILNGLWAGIINYGYGLTGGTALKAVGQTEANFIQGLSQHTGVQLGRSQFYASMYGAPFLLANSPYVGPTQSPCFPPLVPSFDETEKVYGCAAKSPMFQFDFTSSKEYQLAEDLASASQTFAMSAVAAPVLIAAPELLGTALAPVVGADAALGIVAGGKALLITMGAYQFANEISVQLRGQDLEGHALSEREQQQRALNFVAAIAGGSATAKIGTSLAGELTQRLQLLRTLQNTEASAAEVAAEAIATAQIVLNASKEAEAAGAVREVALKNEAAVPENVALNGTKFCNGEAPVAAAQIETEQGAIAVEKQNIVYQVPPELTPGESELSQLQVVPRPGMAVQVIDGVPVYGQTDSPSTTPGHGETMLSFAKMLASTGKYAYITLQRSWRTATGRLSPSGLIPDIIGIRKDGVVDAWEVRSDSQTRLELITKLKTGMSTVPVERQGEFDVLEPEP